MVDFENDVTAQLKRIEGKLDALLARGSMSRPAAGGTSTRAGAVAPDSDLDSKYGDPSIRKDPPRWTGESFAGLTYSACSPEYLDELAIFLDWKAGKNEEDGSPEKLKFAGYDRKDAARARGWAARKRNDGGGDKGGTFVDDPMKW